jgi:LemA protein
MDPTALVPLLVIAFVIGTPVMLYGVMLRMREQCKGTWGELEKDLACRHNLIECLLERLQALNAEPMAITRMIDLRRRSAMDGSKSALARRENELTDAIVALVAAVQQDPRLRSDTPLHRTIQDLLTTEDRVQASGRQYNAVIREYNERCLSIPTSFIARVAHLEPVEAVELKDARERLALSLSAPKFT